ncbi:MAG TPA: IS1595 family transposase, partial [Pseudolabrys sp.]|nr:IS1595 family transposase [Pseudolabrys sp.]
CPHCGCVDTARRLQGVKDKKDNVRNGLWKCYAKECRKQFTVRVGTVFESAHIPLHKCLQAVYLMTASKKGVSSHQLHRILEITYKSAWFLAHRIREAMRDGTLAPMGGAGGIVEVDETYIGKQAGHAKAKGAAHKNIVLTLVERGGRARSHHIASFGLAEVVPIVRTNVRRESRLMSDEARQYVGLGQEFAEHGAVNHGVYEWGRGDVHTNTIEGYFSIFKRGMKGVYQHCAEKHLHRYLAEFDFRYSNRVALGCDDGERASRAIKGIVGKRLTYRAADKTA